MSGPTGVQWLWPVPLLVRRLSQHQQLQQPLLQLFREHRDDNGGGVPYASDDDLVTRYAQHGAVQALAQLLAQGVGEVAHQANQPVWSALQPQGLRVDLVGMWFQISNRYARHDVHTHGNCSWSGVYVVDVDPPQTREAHPDLGEENGLTRLHSPLMDRLGGAHMDLGAAWLQDSHVDIAPVPGQLVIWPSFLMHQALPYAGGRVDRRVTPPAPHRSGRAELPHPAPRVTRSPVGAAGGATGAAVTAAGVGGARSCKTCPR